MFNFGFVLGLVVFVASVLLYIYSQKGDRLLLVGFLITLIFGLFIGGGIHQPALGYSTQEMLLSQQRLNEYPPITWLPVAHWLEERKETIAFYKLMDNFSSVMSPNLYFFANHPRERSGIVEVEKFPYVLLPIFVYGIFLLISEKKKSFFIWSFLVPLTYYSIFGVSGKLDPYLLFPFFAVSITKGILGLKKNMLVIFFILYALVLAQSIIYAKF
jgi:hypothetical protein